MNYTLTKSDYEDIRILTTISESVWESYQTLARLECEGKKETKEYQEAIENLKSTKNMEPVIYGRIGNDYSKLIAIAKYIKTSAAREVDRLEKVIEGQNLVLERILRNLSDEIEIKNEVKKEMEGLLADTELDMSSLINSTAAFISGMEEIKVSFLEDEYACFLAILKKQIASPYNKDIKSELIRAKYHLAFISERMEDYLLKENFEIPRQVYLKAAYIGQLEHQDELTMKRFEQLFAQNIIRCQTQMLFQYDNMALTSSCKRAEAVLRTCILRVGLLFCDDIARENEYFHDVIDGKKYLSMYPNNSKVEKMIMDAYSNNKSDKNIPILVRFIKR